MLSKSQLHRPLSGTLVPLRSADYRRLLAANFIWWATIFMEFVAFGWLALDLTDSVWMVSVAGFFRSLPLLLFGSFGGSVADRFGRRTVIVAAQIARLHRLPVAGPAPLVQRRARTLASLSRRVPARLAPGPWTGRRVERSCPTSSARNDRRRHATGELRPGLGAHSRPVDCGRTTGRRRTRGLLRRHGRGSVLGPR